jgi:hypothetical protein
MKGGVDLHLLSRGGFLGVRLWWAMHPQGINPPYAADVLAIGQE